MIPVSAAWIIFSIVILLVILFCYIVVKYYEDKHEAELLPTIVTVIGLSLTMFCIFLIPLDIYSVSSSVNSSGDSIINPEVLKLRGDVIRVLYYILYTSILVFAFIIIPFAYFYYEENDDRVTIKERVWGGCKYTIFLIIIMIILLVIGFILFLVKPGDKPTNTQNAKEWVQNLIKNQNIAELALSFSIACLTLIGYLCWITYTAYGLSIYPIGIFRGKKHIAEEVSDIQTNLDVTREKSRAIKAKYVSGKKISKKDEGQLNLLERQERILARRGTRLQKTMTGWRKIWSACKPFMFIFGIIFLIVSLLIVTSITLTSIDKVAHSSNFCGSKCGFILAYPQIFNPLDSLLTILAAYFPLDLIVLASLIFYIFFCTLSGITHIGVRFFWVHLYKIRKGSSPPQGLLMAAIILMFSILALNMELTTLAPQYINFGSQVYIANNSTGQTERCSLDAPPNKCTMTQIGTIINTISIRISFFSIIYLIASFIFVGAFLIGSIIAIFKSKPSNIEERDSDSDEDE
jgi:LMBR1 domain-containing protein 1